MNQSIRWVQAFILGLGTMYFLDPKRGKRRRVAVYDQFRHYLKKTTHQSQIAVIDLQHRAQGLIAETKTKFKRDPVSDAVLAERIRSRLGRIVEHPKSVQVDVHHGQVYLGGQVYSHEMASLIREIRRMMGVKRVLNDLNCFSDLSVWPSIGMDLSISHDYRYLLGGLTGGVVAWYAYLKKNKAA
jgi:hypothetical protein